MADIPALVDRSLYPILDQCTYLASHSLGAVPKATRANLERYINAWETQGILAWDHEWWQQLELFNRLIEQVLGAQASTVVPRGNVTEGFASVASCLNYQLRPKVVLTALEFTTTLPFWKGQEQLGAQIVVVPSPDGISVPVDHFAAHIDSATALVITSHAYFRSGALQDLSALRDISARQGAYLLVDGYQAIGSVPFSVAEVDPDFVVGGCHKWLCGGPGAGFLYVRPQTLEKLQPRLTGWFGLADPFSYDPGPTGQQLHPSVRRFMHGTPNIPGLFAAQAGLQGVLNTGVAAIRQHSLALTEAIFEECQRRQLRVRTPHTAQRNGMVCLDFEGAQQFVKWAEKNRLIIDYRPDCGIRVSPHFYNDGQDLAAFWSQLDHWKAEGHGAS